MDDDDDDDSYDFPPTKYPIREAITMTIAAALVIALLVGALLASIAIVVDYVDQERGVMDPIR